MPKGVYKRSKEHLEKMKQNSPFQKGIYQGCGFKKGNKSGKQFQKGNKPSKTTREKLRIIAQGNKWHWKGGKKIDSGYILLYRPNHPFAQKRGYIRRARLVMEKKLGRYLLPTEIVHHKGIKYPISSIENKQDDRIENLQLFKSKSAHTKFHWSLKN